jgi:NADP-dependent 3-hydroxy acid dehydrogenase YdfG
MDSLKDKLGVVTGASSGIGRAIALALAKQGAEVCLVARRRDVLEGVAREARANGTRSHVCAADLTVDADIHNLTQGLQRDFDRVDVLVLCGGAISHGPLDRASLADFDLMYRSNLRAHYAVTQALLPLLRKQRGQIVFINSSAGFRSPANVGQFSATQHALRAVADSLRDEVNSDGIRVLSVYPGRTATPRMAALFEKEGRAYRPELLMQPEDIAATVIHSLSLPRTAEVTDVSMRPFLKSY